MESSFFRKKYQRVNHTEIFVSWVLSECDMYALNFRFLPQQLLILPHAQGYYISKFSRLWLRVFCFVVVTFHKVCCSLSSYYYYYPSQKSRWPDVKSFYRHTCTHMTKRLIKSVHIQMAFIAIPFRAAEKRISTPSQYSFSLMFSLSECLVE